ncbi:MAG: hypothetical protein JW704_09850 [Anaerolineaceae bacterium]|nr:hypothetical protein [Anaerolineaceae bacterium]
MLYLVTSKAQEESTVGTILKVEVRTWGIFTDPERAQAIADKHGGTVEPHTQDIERDGKVIQSWRNPGYVD